MSQGKRTVLSMIQNRYAEQGDRVMHTGNTQGPTEYGQPQLKIFTQDEKSELDEKLTGSLTELDLVNTMFQYFNVDRCGLRLKT